MSVLPDSTEALIAHFSDLPDNQQSFYSALFGRQNINEGDIFLPQLAEHLHRQGENLLALTVIERCGFSENGLLEECALFEELLLTKIKVLHALHSYGRARRLAENMQSRLSVASLQLTGNLASIIKSQALTGASSEQQRLLEQSLELYGLAFTEPLFEGSYWLGVNALAIASCLGQQDYVSRYLEIVRRDCLQASNQRHEPDFWTLATIAELDLIELLNHRDAEPEPSRSSVTLCADNYSPWSLSASTCSCLARGSTPSRPCSRGESSTGCSEPPARRD